MSEPLYQGAEQFWTSSDTYHRAFGRRSLIVLDRVWARRLGVMRTGGIYRIGRHELMRKLAELPVTTLSTPNGFFESNGSRSSSDTKPLLDSATPFRESAA
jgi:hypothetical protein